MKNNQQKKANNPSPAADIAGELVVNAGIDSIAAGVEAVLGLPEAKTTLEKAAGQGSEAFSTGGTMEGLRYGTGGEVADESGISEWIEDLVGGAGETLSSTGEILENALSSTGEVLGDVAEVAGEAVGAAVEGIVSAL